MSPIQLPSPPDDPVAHWAADTIGLADCVASTGKIYTAYALGTGNDSTWRPLPKAEYSAIVVFSSVWNAQSCPQAAAVAPNLNKTPITLAPVAASSTDIPQATPDNSTLPTPALLSDNDSLPASNDDGTSSHRNLEESRKSAGKAPSRSEPSEDGPALFDDGWDDPANHDISNARKETEDAQKQVDDDKLDHWSIEEAQWEVQEWMEEMYGKVAALKTKFSTINGTKEEWLALSNDTEWRSFFKNMSNRLDSIRDWATIQRTGEKDLDKLPADFVDELGIRGSPYQRLKDLCFKGSNSIDDPSHDVKEANPTLRAFFI